MPSLKTAVILSGCGVYDGSEIHESILTLLALSQASQPYQCLAPNGLQTKVVDHVKNSAMVNETRSIKAESARIARGDILSLEDANPEDYDSAILPGGFGAALNLSNFAEQGADCTVDPDLNRFIKALSAAHKPIGFICIAPVLANKILGPGITVTIGNDPATTKAIIKTGGIHQNCAVRDIVIDNTHRVVTTPAYMLATDINQAAIGINKLVNAVLALRALH